MKKPYFSDDRISKIIEDLIIKGDKKTVIIWALDCAEHVLNLFEEKYPYDNRPRKAIEVVRDWFKREIKLSEIRSTALAAHASAREANNDATCAAARAAGQAISTIHTSGHALHAATYATKASYYSSLLMNEGNSILKEHDWQWQRLLELINRRDSI